MSQEQFVDVRYHGLEVGRRLRIAEFGPRMAYLEHAGPLPVDTRLEVTTDEGLAVAVRVVRVEEQVAGASRSPGMMVAWIDADGDMEAVKAWWTPLVSREDPIIPEPAVVASVAAAPAKAVHAVEAVEAVEAAEAGDDSVDIDVEMEADAGSGAEAAAEVPALDAVPEAIEEATVALPAEASDGEVRARGKGKRAGAQTHLMSMAAIQAAIEDVAAPREVTGSVDSGDAEVGNVARSKTEVMSATEIAAALRDAGVDPDALGHAGASDEQDRDGGGDDADGGGSDGGDSDSAKSKKKRRRRRR